VLICPDCQSAGEWVADLDRCRVCASIRLVRRLGEVECRECGNVGEPAFATSPAMSASPAVSPSPAVSRSPTVSPAGEHCNIGEISVPAGGVGTPGLAEEVEQALVRVLRRSTRPHADQLR
jgi:hypothetical protein